MLDSRIEFHSRSFENFWLNQELIATRAERSLYAQKLLLKKTQNPNVSLDQAIQQTETPPHSDKEYELKIIKSLEETITRNHYERERKESNKANLAEITAIENELENHYQIKIRAIKVAGFYNESEANKLAETATHPRLQFLLRKRAFLKAKTEKQNIPLSIWLDNAPEKSSSLSFFKPVFDIVKKIADNIDDIWNSIRNTHLVYKLISDQWNAFIGQVLTGFFSGGINLGEFKASLNKFNKTRKNLDAKQRSLKLATHGISLGFLAGGIILGAAVLIAAFVSLFISSPPLLIAVCAIGATLVSLPPLIKYSLDAFRYYYSLPKAKKDEKDAKEELSQLNKEAYFKDVKELKNIENNLKSVQAKKYKLFDLQKEKIDLSFQIATAKKKGVKSENPDLMKLESKLIEIENEIKKETNDYEKHCKDELELQQQYHKKQCHIEENYKNILDAQHIADRAAQRVTYLKNKIGFKTPEVLCNMSTFAGGVMGLLMFIGVASSVGTLGIAAPVCIAAGLTLGTAIQVFKAMNSKNNHKYTNAISNTFGNLFDKAKNFFSKKKDNKNDLKAALERLPAEVQAPASEAPASTSGAVSESQEQPKAPAQALPSAPVPPQVPVPPLAPASTSARVSEPQEQPKASEQALPSAPVPPLASASTSARVSEPQEQPKASAPKDPVEPVASESQPNLPQIPVSNTLPPEPEAAKKAPDPIKKVADSLEKTSGPRPSVARIGFFSPAKENQAVQNTAPSPKRANTSP